MAIIVAMRARLLIFSLLFASGALADDLPDLGETAQLDLSPQLERRIGEGAMREIRARDPSYLDDPEVIDYLNRLGRRLLSASRDIRGEFEFFALKDASLNAFAMPGGYIGVHTGLILAARSESELASVLAHEISHVSQHHLARMVNKAGQAQLASMLALAVAVLAARSNPDVAMGAALAGQAAGIQSQLNYSRDFEREADRLGLQLLEDGGFDVRGMASFFERLLKYGRLYENGAPGYLRTHPLTTERIADMENRIGQKSKRGAADSIGYGLVRAKLAATLVSAEDAITDFETRLAEPGGDRDAANRYGFARALLRAKRLAEAEKQLAALRRLKVESPMIETLAAEVASARGDRGAALRVLKAAAARYPQERAVTGALAEAYLASNAPGDALTVATAGVTAHPGDVHMREFLARSHAALGQRLAQHRAQAEVYVLQGQLGAAIEQLQLAQKSTDGDFYSHSEVDARLRDLRVEHAEELARKKSGASR